MIVSHPNEGLGMSNEKVLAALFERIEIGKSYYFEGLLSSKDYGDHIYGLQQAKNFWDVQ